MHAAFERDVRTGLTADRKRLSSRFLYDAPGSELFDEITRLEEYYPTQAEISILERIAPKLAGGVPDSLELVELGGGSGEKTARIIRSLLESRDSLPFTAIDISKGALVGSADELLASHPGLELTAIAAEYQDGLAELAQSHERARLLIWLGSSMGNFTREEASAFIRSVRNALTDEDLFLIGVDLRKDRDVLERAYDDSKGVTARFNRNLLERINRELGGRFDIATFRYVARYLEDEGVVRMYLESTVAQTVRIEGLELDVSFEAGERIHTEDSFKYSIEEIDELASDSGLRVVNRWLDVGKRFSLNLLARA